MPMTPSRRRSCARATLDQSSLGEAAEPLPQTLSEAQQRMLARYVEAFEQYDVDGLELDGDRIAGWNSFLDTETLFPRFGLPPAL
jgi:hypothetical protein